MAKTEIIQAPKSPITYMTFNANNYSHLYSHAYLFENGSCITLCVRGIKDVAAQASTILFTLPERLAPTQILYHDALSVTDKHFRYIIQQTGEVSIYNYANEVVTDSSLNTVLTWAI